MKKTECTFDIETDNLLPDVTRVWCAVIKDHQTEEVYSFDFYKDDTASERFFQKLSTYEVAIGHNCTYFDFPVLKLLFGYEYKGIIVDTLLISRTQRPNRKSPPNCTSGPHSVEAWGIRLGQDKVYNDVWDVYDPILMHRCVEDVEIQYKMYKALLREGKGEGWAPAHRINNKLFYYLQQQQSYGWPIDIEKLDSNIHILHHWIERISNAVQPHLPLKVEVLETKKDGEYNYVRKPFKKDGSLSAHTARWVDDNSYSSSVVCGPYCRLNIRPTDLDKNKEVKEYLLQSGWIPTEWNYNGDGEKTSPKFSKDDHFEGIQSSLGRLIARRIQCRQRLGILEGWKELIRHDGRLETPVNGIAATGRLRHKTVVNVPSPHSKAFFARQMREVFTHRPGWVMVGVDSKGNQVRQLAARMQDDEFTEAVLHGTSEDGTDIHSLNQRRSGAPSRSKAKNFFYGFIFGAGAPKIATTIGITIPEARALIETYLNELPALKRTIKELTDQWRTSAQKWFDKSNQRWVYRNGYIRGLDGRRVYIDSEHKILAYALQSDEAIQMAYAYVMFHEMVKSRGHILHEHWGMLYWGHDEFQFECIPHLAEELGQIACDAIKKSGEYLNIQCPHDGDVLIGNNWFETH